MLTELKVFPHALVDDILRVFQVFQMVTSDLLRVSDNLLDLLPEFLLYLGMVDEAEHHHTERGGGGVEPSEEEENGGGDETNLEVFPRKENVLPVLVKLIDEDINDVVSLKTGFSDANNDFKRLNN